MTLLIRYFPQIALAALILALTVFVWKQGYNSCEAKHQTATIKEAKARDKLEAKVMRLSDPDLDARLNRWMRD